MHTEACHSCLLDQPPTCSCPLLLHYSDQEHCKAVAECALIKIIVNEYDTLPSPRPREAGNDCIDGFDVSTNEVTARLCWELLGLLQDSAALAGGRRYDEFCE